MTEGVHGPRHYQQQAAQMRGLAEAAQTEAMRAIYLRLAANLTRLAEERAAMLEDENERRAL